MDHSAQLQQLINEFQGSYLAAEGMSELATYLEIRNSAYQNVATIRDELAKGNDCTDLILRKLLPYADTANNRWLGAWTHVAAAVPGDIRRWYGAAGRTGQEDWPDVATAIWTWLDTITTDPMLVAEACQTFSESSAAKGFQMGMLTPILNALYPEQFHLVNNRTLHVVQFFTGKSYPNSLQQYPEANRGVQTLINEIVEQNPSVGDSGAYPGDLFERFCYWLSAIRRFSLKPQRYWLIATGEDAWQWEEWKDGRFVAMGFDELGDLSDVRKAEFSQRQQSLIAQFEGWTKKRTNLVWRFARQLRDGDRVAVLNAEEDWGANPVQVSSQVSSQVSAQVSVKGSVIGIGTVAGVYYFAPELPHGHRIPVQWEEFRTRALPDEFQSRDALVELTADQFRAIEQAPQNNAQVPPARHAQTVPAFVHCFIPILDFLRSHPNGATTTELVQKIQTVLEETDLPQNVGWSQVEHVQESTTSNQQLARTIHRARYHLAKAGLIDSPRRGRWQATDYGRTISLVDAEMVRIYEEVEYQRRVEETLHHESAIIRRLAESAMPYNAHTLNEFPAGVTSNGSGRGDHVALEGAEQDATKARLGKDAQTANPSAAEEQEPRVPEQRSPFLDSKQTQPYTLSDCASDTGFAQADLTLWMRTLQRKRQIILTGPSGTGKTYLAHHLARVLTSSTLETNPETDSEQSGFWELVQFHPGVAYEDFVQGLRPTTAADGGAAFAVKPGRFLEFCQRAKSVAGPAVLIIDEINRANLARVFGECMYLLEYREGEAILAGNGERFQIPANVYLIGTMNTADRSVALIDHAMRRRFGFIQLGPNYDVLRHFHSQRKTGVELEPLIELLKQVNFAIGDPHQALGITYFLTEALALDLSDIWQTEIEPTLMERFYDNPQTVEQFRWNTVRKQIGIQGGGG